MSRSPHRGAALSLWLLIGFGGLSLVLDALPLPGPDRGELAQQLLPPDAHHWFGTDALGRDLFTRTLFGIRSSLFIGMLAASVSLVLGVGVGATAGFCGRRIDALLMRLVDALYGIPFICLVIFLLAVLRDHEPRLRALGLDRNAILFLAVGGTTWLTMARLVRNEIARLAALPFVEAAFALGLSRPRILLRHVLPNAAGMIAVALTMTIPSIVMYEAFLSFLGLGLEPPDVSLGRLTAEGVEAISPLHNAWWMIAFPGGALVLLLLTFSLLGDALRDRLDPTLAGNRRG